MNASVLDSTSRPSKRIRRDTSERTPDEKDVTKKRMFFGELPDNANENIVRHMSSVPNAKDFTRFVTDEDLETILEMEGDIGRCMLSRFDSIIVTLDKSRDYVRQANNWIFVSSVDLAYKIIILMGETLKTIHCGQYSELLLEFRKHEMFNSISEKCPNIETVRPLSIQWPREIVHRLKNVDLALYLWSQIITDVPFAGIRQLSYIDLDVCFLKRSNAWEKVGNTLEILKMRAEGRVGKEIRKIQKYCRKLKVIDIHDVYRSDTTLAECLSSYEGQLEFATIHDMDGKLLETVVEKCTNAQFSLEFYSEVTVNPLRIVGNKVEKVTFGYTSNFNADIPTSASAWNLCSNLQELIFYRPPSVKEVELIVSKPKLFLKTIDISFRQEGVTINVKKALNALAAGWVTTLETVSFSCVLPPSDTFDTLVKRNKSLRKVQISILDAYDMYASRRAVLKARLADFIKCFFQAPLLEILKFMDAYRELEPKFQDIEELYRTSFRHRAVHLNVMGVDY